MKTYNGLCFMSLQHFGIYMSKSTITTDNFHNIWNWPILLLSIDNIRITISKIITRICQHSDDPYVKVLL